MANQALAPVRLSVFCGFLGSGKTTFIRHQLRVGALFGAVLIINEAAGVPVDPELLPGVHLHVLAGGCACCDGREALLSLLRDLLAAPVDRPRWIVLETSGMADPGPLLAAIAASDLAARLTVGEVITVVDVLHGPATLRSEGLARAQVASANALVLSKLDCVAPEAAAALAAGLRLLNPRAPMFGAIKGEATPLPPEGNSVPEDFAGGATNPLPLVAMSLPLPPGTDWGVLHLWAAAVLHAHHDTILRMKAVVRTQAGRLLLQTVRQSVQAPEILPEGTDITADDELVVIGRGVDPAVVRRSLSSFARAAARGTGHQDF